jgi:centromere protein I
VHAHQGLAICREPTANNRLNLSRQTGGDPNLTGLLRVFKNYYPEIIVGDITKGRAASFKVGLPQLDIEYSQC